MSNPATRASLILRIRNRDDGVAWSEFIDLYAPLLYSYGLKHGLQDSDAADMAQESLRQVLRAIQSFNYDRSKGSFRGWLLTIARNEIRRLARRSQRLRPAAEDSQLVRMLEEQTAWNDDEAFEREYQLQLFRWAAAAIESEFRPATWQAFWQSVVEGQPSAIVAERLGISVGAVYIARSRVLARIREKIAYAREQFED